MGLQVGFRARKKGVGSVVSSGRGLLDRVEPRSEKSGSGLEEF